MAHTMAWMNLKGIMLTEKASLKSMLPGFIYLTFSERQNYCGRGEEVIPNVYT